MFSTKKAQGMSLNTVIIAIIVLVVLVVLVMIFTGYFGRIFAPGVNTCAAQGGACSAVGDCKSSLQDQAGNPLDGKYIQTKDCKEGIAVGSKVGDVCCLKGQ